MQIKPLGLIVHGLCFLGVNVFAIECILKHGFHSAFKKNKLTLTVTSNILWAGLYLRTGTGKDV